MRYFNKSWFGIGVGLAVCSSAMAQPAATYHFAGCSRLAGDTNFANVKTIFSLTTSIDFRNLVLNRFAGWLGDTFHMQTNSGASSPVRPLLDDLLSAESMGAFGGNAQGPLNFVLAIQLDDKQTAAWKEALRQAFGSAGETLNAPGAVGLRWNSAGGTPFWLLRAGKWVLVGSGTDFQAIQSDYLQQISQHGAPGPALGQSWLEADIDWSHLTHWLPDSWIPLKPARTKIVMTARDSNLRMNATVTYPSPVAWKTEAWNVPSDLIRDPLISFTASQDVAAFMKSDEPLARLTDNPLNGETFVWGVGEMVFQTYAAWAVKDRTNVIERIAAEAKAAYNPGLKKIDGGTLDWQELPKTMFWQGLLPVMIPCLQLAPGTNSPYILVSLFPISLRNGAAPQDLFDQIKGRDNLVYYDWELTGPRLQQWRAMSSIFPIYPDSETIRPRKPSGTTNSTRVASTNSTNSTPGVHAPKPSGLIEENWITGITPLLPNTVTEITKTGLAELTVVRKSPLGLSSLELILLSHWLAGVGNMGMPASLLPPPAKVTGPGIPP